MMPKSRPRKVAASAAANNGQKKRQPYHLTCSNCRNRKTRCDGSQPQCLICAAYGEECNYDKAPPMSQITAMAERISELEETIKKLKENATSGISANSRRTANAAIDASNPDIQLAGSGSSIQIDGQPSQYSSTSAIDGLTSARLPQPPSSNASTKDTSQATSTALRSRSFEGLAIRVAAMHLGLSEETITVLLRTHFTWAHPTFLFVYRPAFMRDMAAGGPYFSYLLLLSIILHSTRFTQKFLTEDLHFRAKMTLGQEIHKDACIATVQALLQFSAYESGKGSVSQAWLYSGMAFRMAVDIGLFGPNVGSPIDVHGREIRTRLAWSCFIWDKAISLYLGRMPALPDTPMQELVFSDQSTETELWSPYYGPEEGQGDYAPSPAYTLSNFANFCKLGIIINDILANIYGKRRLKDPTFVQRAHERLVAFRAATPDHLKVEPVTRTSPPIHVLSQNLLYYTTVILLYRPFRASESCRDACRQAARSVEKLLLLLEKTFSFSHVTYMMAYCAYTAATIAVEDWRENVTGSESMVNTYLRALHALVASCPGIQRSIDIIMRNFTTPDTSQFNNTSTLTNMSYDMPAFPLNDAHFGPNQGTHSFELDPDLLPFSALHSFPQHGMDIPDDFFTFDPM